jgi:hypothetical protein
LSGLIDLEGLHFIDLTGERLGEGESFFTIIDIDSVFLEGEI